MFVVKLLQPPLYRKYLGWRGFLIEASSLSYPRHFMGTDLPAAADVTLETVVSGIVKFVPEKFLETVYKDANQDAAVKIQSHILSRVGLKHFDFMSLDVEGAELAVLKCIDFEAVRVSVMLIETDGHDKTKDEEVREIMLENGYELLEGSDRAFLRNSSGLCTQKFHALPSAFVGKVT